MSGIFKAIKGLDPRNNDTVTAEPVKEGAMEPWKEIADSIIAGIKERAEKFLDENAAAKDFVLERSKRLAQLIFEYKTATDDAVRQERKIRMELVQSTIETELAALALSGSTEAKDTFKEVVKTAFGILVKALPSILAAI